MVQIIESASRVTLINVHECAPEHQDELAALLLEGARTIYAKQPGFVSATVHKSLDGSAVTNYAQYDSRAAIEALRTNPAIAPFVDRVNRLIQGVAPRLYQVAGIVEGA